MCNREISSRRIDCFFSAKLYDHQGPIARGGGGVVRQPPPDRPRYEKCPDRARVKALGPVNFSNIALYLNGAKGFGPPDDVTVKAAAEWWTGADRKCPAIHTPYPRIETARQSCSPLTGDGTKLIIPVWNPPSTRVWGEQINYPFLGPYLTPTVIINRYALHT